MLPERTAQVAGFRYFNVYGPREQHKGRMASVAFHFFQQYRSDRRVQLFEGSGGYSGAGEQRRDFVFVDDVVAVNLDFLDHPERSGIYNVGSGRAQTFNEVAVATINACRAGEGQAPLTLVELVRRGRDRVRSVPPQLVGKYQSFTQADLHGPARRGVSGADAGGGARRHPLRRKSDFGSRLSSVTWTNVVGHPGGLRCSYPTTPFR